MIKIENNGSQLTYTNYWQTEHAKKGLFYVSINAGCMRLLVPESQYGTILEIKTGKSILIERGKWKDQYNRDALVITFDDRSKTPYCIFVLTEQCDRLISEKKCTLDFAVYTQRGLLQSWKNAQYKTVDYL